MTLKQALEAATKAFHGDRERVTATLVFSGDEFFFQGHFPERPLLPAVVQVGAVTHFASRAQGRELRLAEVRRAKFTSPVGPGVELRLAITLEEAEEGLMKASARITDGEVEIAELSLRLR